MKRRSAFTLIELLVVVAVIAVLAAIAVPNFLEAQIRSKIARSKSDMDVLEAAIHAYYADYTVYPPSHPEMLDLIKYTLQARKAEELAAATRPVPAPTPKPYNAYGGGYGGYSGGGFNNPFGGRTKPIADDDTSTASLQWPEQGYYGDGWRGDTPPPRYRIIQNSGFSLSVITTPVAYFSRTLPYDLFADRKNQPFGYVNLVQVREKLDLKPEEDTRRYVLSVVGPSQMGIPPFPLDPVILYDPTNGTSSRGMVARFGN